MDAPNDTPLSALVKVERRFALSARVDADLNGTPPLTGYVMQESVRKALNTMLDGIVEGGQTAFTWTGPYGGGKSCAALLVANLVAGAKKQRTVAQEIVGPELAGRFASAFAGKRDGWRALAVTGRRASMAEALATAAGQLFGWSDAVVRRAAENDRLLVERLEQEANAASGVLIVIDELGKFFEHAVKDGGDIHLLQDLAERSARSNGRLMIIGILHQSFEQYAGQSRRSVRDEWSKVQGRFQNLPFVAQPDEVAALISRAIVSTVQPSDAQGLAQRTAEAVAKRRPTEIPVLGKVLAKAWPLHPVTTLLLGPVSRQRFAQNERSVFGFLSSAEPNGFQSYLSAATMRSPLYEPDRLWDYLVANFGTALAVGPEGNRMSLALEAVERATFLGPLAVKLTKVSAIIEIFRNGSGLAVSDDILELCAPKESPGEVKETLEALVARAILIRQPRLSGYALFAGSDFDLDKAIGGASEKLSPTEVLDLPGRLGIGPIAAKKHYFETGALRVFDVYLQLAEDAADLQQWAQSCAAALEKRQKHTTGALVLVLPDGQTSEGGLKAAIGALRSAFDAANVLAAVGTTERSYLLREYAVELYAIDRIEAMHPQLQGDRIARRELSARQSQTTDTVRAILLSVLMDATWSFQGHRISTREASTLAQVVSLIASKAFPKAPTIHSELLNRDKASSSAMAGLRDLVHAMVGAADQENLAIEGYPVERGHYITVLRALGVHRRLPDGTWRFTDPHSEGQSASLQPAWELLSAKSVNLGAVYDLWAARPYGIKRAVMPVLALAFLLAHRRDLAVYHDGLFQTEIDDVFADRLLQDPSVIEFRQVSRSRRDEAFVEQLAALLSRGGPPVEPQALAVASTLFQRFHDLPLWAQRTSSLDTKTVRIRDVALKANDPEALLFTDLAEVLKGEADPAVAVVKALKKAEAAYPAMLDALRAQLADFLGVEVGSFEGIGPRAIAAKNVSAELRLEAFIMRTGAFEGGAGDIEGLASLLVHKPPRTWTDREQEQASFELAKLAQRFREAETFATIKGRRATSTAISVAIGIDPRAEPVFRAFDVSERELANADAMADKLMQQLAKESSRDTVKLAAVARLVERLAAGVTNERGRR